jgi:GrpB-like predicted nucleotidyltransferase (UPF0157 family)
MNWRRLLRRIRFVLIPWWLERDHEVGFKRWLRDTEHGRAGYREFRRTLGQVAPDQLDQWPEELPPLE